MYKVMIVDDENLEVQSIKFIIKKNYPQIQVVGEAGYGEQAVKIAIREEPDIILMDIRMPGMNGLEATKVIKRLCRTSLLCF